MVDFSLRFMRTEQATNEALVIDTKPRVPTQLCNNVLGVGRSVALIKYLNLFEEVINQGIRSALCKVSIVIL